MNNFIRKYTFEIYTTEPMSTYRIYLFIFFISLYSLAVMSQETRTIKFGNNLNMDSLRQAYLMERELKATEQRESYLKLLANADQDTVLKINMAGLYIHECPDLSAFGRTKEINASNNRFTKIKKSDLATDSLQKITFSNNDLTSFCLSAADQLKSIYLNSNSLKKIPGSIRKAHQLEFLNLERNDIRRIPRFLLKMDSLKEINLNDNQIKLSRSAIRRLAKIDAVLLAGNKLDQLPDNMGEMTGVKKLNFSNNRLHDLPESFSELEQLTNIIFYKNEFEEIPEEVFLLTNLVELDFYYNKIKVIPEGVGNLTKLKQLFLSFNEISALPDTLQSLKNIRYFFVHHNLIHEVPLWISQFDQLERLDLSFNNIFVLPDLSQMESLAELDIQNNQIEYFPWDLLDKPGMRILNTKNNPFILSSEEKKILGNWDNNLASGKLILIY